MNVVIRSVFIFVVIVAICVTGLPAELVAASNSKDLMKSVSNAQDAVKKGKYKVAIDHLTPYASEKLDADTAGTIHYLLGTSKFNITFQDIQQCRDGGTQKKDALQDHQIGPLKEALQHFRMVYEIAPQHSMAAESLYMAGRALDWGCLQRFQEALDSYSLAFENFPEQEFGKKARQRYDILNAKMSPHNKKPSIPHRPMGTTKGSSPH